MNMNIHRSGLIISLMVMAISALSCAPKASLDDIAILPKPSEIVAGRGVYVLPEDLTISSSDTSERMNALISYARGFIVCGADIRLVLDGKSSLPSEGYDLKIGRRGIVITAPECEGLLYGLQTLRQLTASCPQDGTLPCLEIRDWPRFSWRGLHLDVSRHFYDARQVKLFIDRMAMYKFNVFHWHLTDDQGWRMEIKSHPEFTQKGAWRRGKGFADNQRLGFNAEDGRPYGGYYTQDEIRDVIAYAAVRGITIVPEIDLPGHSTAAVVARPDIFCFPGRKMEVRMEGGVSEGVLCAGKEITFDVLEDVLGEVMDLFPSEYIHVGGDEAPKAGWKKCPHCQARIKAEGLADENELQSWFMKRLEKIINARGRRMIGWDEIMEGGLSPTATVMSWRGVLPGLEAAKGGNDVVMTPGSYVYLSQPQSVNSVTRATGNVLSLRKVYEFNPLPDGLSDQQAAHILGVQACQWTEHTPTEQLLYYKEYPRAIAVAEIGWTAQEDRNWEDFYSRLQKHLPQLTANGIPYGAPCYDVRIAVSPDADGNPQISFVKEVDEPVHFTLDGSDPTEASPVYAGPVPVCGDCCVKACIFRPDGSQGRIATQDVRFHKAVGKKVTYALPYSLKHDGGGDYAMTNGMLDRWQGFEKQDADFTIDLGSAQPVQSISSRWKYDIMDWVLRPLDVTYLVSADGVEYTELYRQEIGNTPGDFGKGIIDVEASCHGKSVRYIRVRATSPMINPKWHSSAGAACWLFVDEIVVL